MSLSLHVVVLLWSTLMLMSSLLQAVPHSPANYETDSNFELSCTKDFVLHDSNCYRYFGYDVKRPFHVAQKMCLRFYSSLVSLHTLEEEAFVVQMTENNSAFWIGLSDEDDSLRREGLFQWVSGEEMKGYKNWKSGEPVNKQHLDCVKADHSGWSMAKGGCASSKLPFVCKKRACRYGYEWSGDNCKEVPSEEELSSSNLSSLYLSLSLCLMVVCLLASYSLGCYFSHKHRLEDDRTKDSTRDRLEHRPLRTANRVQDLYPT